MNKYVFRATHSERGELFNPLIWPFLIATFAYSVGFLTLFSTEAISKSSLWVTMHGLWAPLPFVWGSVCFITIVMGLTFLMFKIPPIGRLSGLLGFMIWVFAGLCWALTGGYITLFSIALPNMYFWMWQYISLSNFRRQEADDRDSMKTYDTGGYDDINPNVNSKSAREDNRGRDLQSNGSYDNPDNGGDLSRPLDDTH
jgi:hypothetical protein